MVAERPVSKPLLLYETDRPKTGIEPFKYLTGNGIYRIKVIGFNDRISVSTEIVFLIAPVNSEPTIEQTQSSEYVVKWLGGKLKIHTHFIGEHKECAHSGVN